MEKKLFLGMFSCVVSNGYLIFFVAIMVMYQKLAAIFSNF
jgi:hypothetical protein